MSTRSTLHDLLGIYVYQDLDDRNNTDAGGNRIRMPVYIDFRTPKPPQGHNNFELVVDEISDWRRPMPETCVCFSYEAALALGIVPLKHQRQDEKAASIEKMRAQVAAFDKEQSGASAAAGSI